MAKYAIGPTLGQMREFAAAVVEGVPWGAVVGLRNVIIHGYDRVHRDRIWDTAVADIPALLRTVEALLTAGGGASDERLP